MLHKVKYATVPTPRGALRQHQSQRLGLTEKKSHQLLRGYVAGGLAAPDSMGMMWYSFCLSADCQLHPTWTAYSDGQLL